jgi:hypothetical protein
VKEGEDLYTLMLMSEARHDDALCRQAMNKIIANWAVGSGALAGADKPNGANKPSTTQRSGN